MSKLRIGYSMHYRKTMPAPSSDIPFEFIHPWLFQALPTLDTGLVTHYFYTMFLIMLLTDCAFCNDDCCRNMYGPHWDKYCHSVPCKKVWEYLKYILEVNHLCWNRSFSSFLIEQAVVLYPLLLYIKNVYSLWLTQKEHLHHTHVDQFWSWDDEATRVNNWSSKQW